MINRKIPINKRCKYIMANGKRCPNRAIILGCCTTHFYKVYNGKVKLEIRV